jgi:hypothetical protein
MGLNALPRTGSFFNNMVDSTSGTVDSGRSLVANTVTDSSTGTDSSAFSAMEDSTYDSNTAILIDNNFAAVAGALVKINNNFATMSAALDSVISALHKAN